MCFGLNGFVSSPLPAPADAGACAPIVSRMRTTADAPSATTTTRSSGIHTFLNTRNTLCLPPFQPSARAIAPWSEFGAARWGGGAVDSLGVGRERWRRQPPDHGAGVGGHGGDDLFDALGIAFIHQHPEHEWEVLRPDGSQFVLQ